MICWCIHMKVNCTLHIRHLPHFIFTFICPNCHLAIVKRCQFNLKSIFLSCITLNIAYRIRKWGNLSQVWLVKNILHSIIINSLFFTQIPNFASPPFSIKSQDHSFKLFTSVKKKKIKIIVCKVCFSQFDTDKSSSQLIRNQWFWVCIMCIVFTGDWHSAYVLLYGPRVLEVPVEVPMEQGSWSDNDQTLVPVDNDFNLYCLHL